MSIQKTIKVDSRRPNLNARFFEQGLPKSAVLLSFKEFDKLIRKSITRFPGEVFVAVQLVGRLLLTRQTFAIRFVFRLA